LIVFGSDFVVAIAGTAASTNAFDSLGERNNGCHALVLNEHLVGDDAGDEIIAVVLGTAQQIEMPDMKEIECPGRIADADHGSVLLFDLQ